MNSFQTQGKGQAFVKKDEKNLKMIQKQSDQMMMGQRVLGQPYGDHLKKKSVNVFQKQCSLYDNLTKSVLRQNIPPLL